MGRLRGTTVYLSGPMDRVEDGGVGWREDLSPFLWDMGIGVFDPCKKPIVGVKEDDNTRDQIYDAKANGNLDLARELMRPISNADLRMVDVAHFIIVYLDLDVHMAGTYHELSLSIMQKKPTLIMCKQGRNKIPNWWFGVVPPELFFNSWDEVKSYVNHIDLDDEIDDLNRWWFFDWDKVFGYENDR